MQWFSPSALEINIPGIIYSRRNSLSQLFKEVFHKPIKFQCLRHGKNCYLQVAWNFQLRLPKKEALKEQKLITGHSPGFS